MLKVVLFVIIQTWKQPINSKMDRYSGTRLLHNRDEQITAIHNIMDSSHKQAIKGKKQAKKCKSKTNVLEVRILVSFGEESVT